MSIAGHHAEWLSLLDVSGPFLSVNVLVDAFPNGLDKHESAVAAELHAAYEAWSDPESSEYETGAADDLHEAFVRFVLQRVLGLDAEDVRTDEETLEGLTLPATSYDAELRPDAVLVDDDPLMLIGWVSREFEVDQPLPGDAWTASPRERMAEHLREAGCPLGLVTNGEQWTLVSWREGQVPGYATWWASLWREERLTLQAFRTLLGEKRFFSVPEEETLPGLLERSAEDQNEVTTKLGRQTLDAVEILIRTIDRLDRDRGGHLLEDIDESELYDAAVTVMMRLIFLFFAEENDLLPMAEDLYVEEYAASTLRARLQEQADQATEQVLETRSDAWPRLLSLWRAVFAGVEHGDMRIAPYGGGLFDPDRYPFLEGRLPGSSWAEAPADPLPIDNRTVLHLLNALQTLDEGGHRRRLSFRALDVEQIGHVYEGMLDHTAKRADGWVLGLSGTGGREPEIPLADLEEVKGEHLVAFLKDETGRDAGTTERWLKADQKEEIEKTFGNRWAAAFGGDADAEQRIRPFAKFLRADSTGGPTVFPPGSVYVCDSSHRGATGTHYTPRTFTQEMVKETLDPLLYKGIAEGWPEDSWKLRTPEEILDLNVADPACGSGAFLVQACRYLSERLVESRRLHGELSRDPTEEDLIEARRQVAGRCLYGVDINPMALEMAKLSLWLVTLDRNKPFSFLDHALRVGDSLFGLSDLDQLRYWDLSGEGEAQELFVERLAEELDEASRLRRELESSPVLDMEDAARKAEILKDVEEATHGLRAAADLLFAPSLASESDSEIEELRRSVLILAAENIDKPASLRARAQTMLHGRRPLHWPLEFPEVFDGGGFDAFVGNPPFMGGQGLTGTFGRPYREYLVERVASGVRGSADLVAYFFLKAFRLLTDGGELGFLASNTISEGDTRQVGLEQILKNGGQIHSAVPNEAWPNAAAVVTSRVHIRRGRWCGPRSLADRSVEWISAFLTDQEEWSPRRLNGNADVVFQGTIFLGAGFLMDPVAAAEILESDGAYGQALMPFLNGRDLNSDPRSRPSRYIINFWDWAESRAREFPALFDIVERLVKPERRKRKADGSFKQRRPLPQLWWIHAEKRPALYHAIGRGEQFVNHPDTFSASDTPLARVVVCALTSKYWCPTLVENTPVFANTLGVFASDSAALLALLSSCVHSEWAWKQSSKMKRDLRYTPSDCFETFPLPVHGELPDDAELDDLGEELHGQRRSIMAREEIGLTTLYNRFHDSDDSTEGLGRLRTLQVTIDERVLELYEWSDISLEHDFREVGYLPESDRVRYAISEGARNELLRRLGRLNRDRYEEEVEAGLHGKKAKAALSKRTGRAAEGGRGSTNSKRRNRPEGQPSLFQDAEEE